MDIHKRPERKCIAGLFALFGSYLQFLGFLSSVRCTDRGLQATLFFLCYELTPELATSPWFRLVSGVVGSSFVPLCFNSLILFSFYFTLFCLTFYIILLYY